jgi:Ca-activated chloride channel family protein
LAPVLQEDEKDLRGVAKPEAKAQKMLPDRHGSSRAPIRGPYHSTNPATDGAFHKIVVQVKRPNLTVRAKAGYYAR